MRFSFTPKTFIELPKIGFLFLLRIFLQDCLTALFEKAQCFYKLELVKRISHISLGLTITVLYPFYLERGHIFIALCEGEGRRDA